MYTPTYRLLELFYQMCVVSELTVLVSLTLGLADKLICTSMWYLERYYPLAIMEERLLALKGTLT